MITFEHRKIVLLDSLGGAGLPAKWALYGLSCVNVVIFLTATIMVFYWRALASAFASKRDHEQINSCRYQMKRVGQMEEAGGAIDRTQVPATRPAMDYTARIVPRYDGFSIPLEYAGIIWQR